MITSHEMRLAGYHKFIAADNYWVHCPEKAGIKSARVLRLPTTLMQPSSSPAACRLMAVDSEMCCSSD